VSPAAGGDTMELEPDAIECFERDDPLGCVYAVMPHLPRTDVRNLLMLFASLGRLRATDLLRQISRPVIRRLLPLREDDPELFECFAVLLQREHPLEVLSDYRGATGQRLAFWTACRLGHLGETQRASELLERSLQLDNGPAVEGYLAWHLIDRAAVGSGPPVVSTIDMALLTVRLLLALELDELMPAAARRLAELGAALGVIDAAIEARICEATALLRREQLTAAQSLIGAHLTDLVMAPASVFAQAMRLAAVMARHADEASTRALLDELFVVLARRPPGPTTADLAVMLLLDVGAREPETYAARVVDVLVATDALDHAEARQLRQVASHVLARDNLKAARYLADVAAARGDDDLEVVVTSALHAYRLALAASADDRQRLVRAAETLLRATRVGPEVVPAVTTLAHLLISTNEEGVATALTTSALASTHGMLDEQALTELTITHAAALDASGDGRAAQLAIADLLGRLRDDLDSPSPAREAALIAAIRIGLQFFEIAVACLYELRYRLEQRAEPPPDATAEVAVQLGKLHMFFGARGAAQRYLFEPIVRDDLAAAEEQAKRSAEFALTLVSARSGGHGDGGYVELVESALADKSESAGAHESADATSFLEPMSRFTDRRNAAQLNGDVRGVIEVQREALAYLAGRSDSPGYLRTSVQQGLALNLAAAGEFETAIDHWLTALNDMTRHLLEIAASAPLEDLRELCLSVSQALEVGLSMAGRVGRIRESHCAARFVENRALWTDLRLLRRAAGGDAASPERSRIGAARCRAARMRFDGPVRDSSIKDYWEALRRARLDRDLGEIASVHLRVDPGRLTSGLADGHRAAIAALGDDHAFIGYYLFAPPAPALFSLDGGLRDIAEDRYIAITWWGGVCKVHPIGDAKDIDGQVRALPSELRARALSPTRQADTGEPFEALRRTLVDPVQPAFAGGEPVALFVLGEGLLAELPWPELFRDDRHSPSDVTIVQTFRSIGRVQRTSVRLDAGALVIGRPDYGYSVVSGDRPGGMRRFSDLPTTEVETRIVAEHCGASAVVGDAAQTSVLLASSPTGILHVASHGYTLPQSLGAEASEAGFDELGAEFAIAREDLIPGPLIADRIADPLLHVGVAMAGVNRWLSDDGRAVADWGVVTAEDLCWTKLGDVDCVVLSMCSSGTGAGTRAAGSRGMRFAALMAGARWTIATLWPVPDVASAVLIEWLYDGFIAGLDPPAALAAAQRALRDADTSRLRDTTTMSRLMRSTDSPLAHRYVKAIIADAAPRPRPFEHPYYWSGFTCSC
jgi:CHAT domain-containing protein